MDAVSATTRLLHLAGFGTGIALYAMLGVMAFRVRRTSGDGRDRIPLATAVLGVLWNVGALVLYSGRDLGLTTSSVPFVGVLGTIAFSALGFLPAVVVHSSVLGRESASRTAIVVVAYALSTLAAVLHLWTGTHTDTIPSRNALLLLTVGYALLLPVLAFVVRRQSGWRTSLMAAALASFAVMARHLSHHTASGEPVVVELLGDHASIPLALVILYQDFRFALADLFLKRVLAAVSLVVLGAAAYVFVVVPFVLPRLTADPGNPVAIVTLLVLWSVAALAARPIRRLTWAFVDRVVLRRTDYRAFHAQLARTVAGCENIGATLEVTRDGLATALAASRVAAHESSAEVTFAGGASGIVSLVDHGTVARVVVPTSDLPHYELEIAGLAPGRRLLSDDVALLEQASITVARRIDALRMAQERVERGSREQEIMRLATEAELRALRAQLNPHFLFNALGTIGYLVQAAPERALGTLYRLTDLLRAVLRPSAGELHSLDEELAVVESYLAIERERFEERLRVTLDVSDEARATLLPAMLVQPLVENAVKHGISPRRAGGEVVVRARVTADDAEGRILHLTVTDSGAGAGAGELARGRASGLGLDSIERRLSRHYGDAASMRVESTLGRGTVVELRLPAEAGVLRESVAHPSATHTFPTQERDEVSR